ncbi:MAG: CDP-alcohol phosphatidyltransferase family protein [Desulfuromonadales bacterium]
MAIKVRIFKENNIRLWGLSSRERLGRMLAKAGVTSVQADAGPIAEEDSVLLLRGDFLYDQRIIQNMVGCVGIVMEAETPQGPRPVAAHVSGALASRMEAILIEEDSGRDRPEGLRYESPETLVNAYQKDLRKFDIPYLLPVSAKNRRSLEKRLFDGSYKGVTDLVTKWLWPTPARWVTGFCARHGISPNQVTTLSLVLSALAVLMFYKGFYATGLFMAWSMTFLDTVDGKLARVTLNYSTFGNTYDHAIDLIFPPVWYVMWALSLQSLPLVSTEFAIQMVLAGYLAGRLVEVVFKQFLESSGIFCWQPIDSCFRLITGRRNPNLVLLTVCLFFNRPDIGLLAVCLWTVLSSIFLLARLVMGIQTRMKSGPLRSWFLDVDPTDDSLSVYQRWFCRRPKVVKGYE